MRKLLLLSTVAAAGVFAATPAAAQFSVGFGYPSYGYSYPSYGYAYPSYGYSYPSYGYSYPSYGYGYSNAYSYYPRHRSYAYGYSGYNGYGTYYSCRPRRHHHNGIVYYTRSC
jgi:hypothetical protein